VSSHDADAWLSRVGPGAFDPCIVGIQGPDELVKLYQTVMGELKNRSGPQSAIHQTFYVVYPKRGVALVAATPADLRKYIVLHDLGPDVDARKVGVRAASDRLSDEGHHSLEPRTLGSLLRSEFNAFFVGSLYHPRVGLAGMAASGLGWRFGGAIEIPFLLLFGAFLGYRAGHGWFGWGLFPSLLTAVVGAVVIASFLEACGIGDLIKNVGFLLAYPFGCVVGFLARPLDQGVRSPDAWRSIGPSAYGLVLRLFGLPALVLLAIVCAIVFFVFGLAKGEYYSRILFG